MNQLLDQLNDDQKEIAQLIIGILNNSYLQHSRLIFVDGPAGTGKTFLYNVINKIVNLIGKKILNYAWTGIAACLLPQGQSSHSLFKLPVPLTSSKNSSKITQAKNGLLWNQLQLVDVIIWDEAPMASKWATESVDKKLKEIRKNNKDFGGVLMIFGGDFRQVLPIVKFGALNEQVNASIQKSNLQRKFDCLKLKKNMRTGEGSEEFSSFLMQIGNGTMQQDKNEMIDIPYICMSQENLIMDIFGDEILNTNQQVYDVILCTTNNDSDDINDCVLRLLKCEPIQLLSSVKATLKNGESLDEITRDVLNNLTPAALPPHILNIKIGASVMLLRNMNIKLGLCNRTRLKVIAIKPSVIQCIILTGPTAGTVVFVPKMDITSTDTDYPFILHRHQFPLKLGYAMTINKSQGQTLNKVGIHLRQQVFTHGQLYVALSRCRKMNDLKIFSTDLKNKQINKMKNVVFKEALKKQ
ncbi:MAG: putative ATP-dependent DNA helicase PIF1 [Streblomastix strix]|uniref:ATP-dependent DNA helicase n=1 Tax=Streblomastix strix TaxID=222440 RepID=A0A5J4X862_9EUKA|nr:MAG: putative ATP-dependent DNA helicase PIF1 [Streblomastix strix]